jgi:hypothetical protein
MPGRPCLRLIASFPELKVTGLAGSLIGCFGIRKGERTMTRNERRDLPWLVVAAAVVLALVLVGGWISWRS